MPGPSDFLSHFAKLQLHFLIFWGGFWILDFFCCHGPRAHTENLEVGQGRTRSACQGISGVLVRLTTCKRCCSLPKQSLITLSPPRKRRDSRSAGYTGGPVNIQAVSCFLGITGRRVFFKFDMGKV